MITPSRAYVMRAKPGPVAKLLPHEMGWVRRVASLLAERRWGWETTYVLLVAVCYALTLLRYRKVAVS